MGDFFEDLGKKITETADMITKKTERVMEIQKLQNQIRNLERANERDLRDLGRMVFVAYKTDGDVKEPYHELCENLKQREEMIEDLKNQLEELRGSGKCPECNATVQDDMAFCPQCGAKLVKETPEDDIFEDESVVSETAAEETVAEETADEADKEADENCTCSKGGENSCDCGCGCDKEEAQESCKPEEAEETCEKKECESGE